MAATLQNRFNISLYEYVSWLPVIYFCPLNFVQNCVFAVSQTACFHPKFSLEKTAVFFCNVVMSIFQYPHVVLLFSAVGNNYWKVGARRGSPSRILYLPFVLVFNSGFQERRGKFLQYFVFTIVFVFTIYIDKRRGEGSNQC